MLMHPFSVFSRAKVRAIRKAKNILMHPFSVFSRAKVRSIRKAKNMLMHRKNNQKGIKKPIIGHNKAIWF